MQAREVKHLYRLGVLHCRREMPYRWLHNYMRFLNFRPFEVRLSDFKGGAVGNYVNHVLDHLSNEDMELSFHPNDINKANDIQKCARPTMEEWREKR
eukprot:TRINITY_DN8650_c0_g1_i1.p1 TRINITY_DN8650_c0_g1~~TRINITY_DN8650_c0_g1_i1.p1  ORF type:complete len:97 (+),score=11.01 TRINITY_DN8650_c0_g1_i1:148-438(+)